MNYKRKKISKKKKKEKQKQNKTKQTEHVLSSCDDLILIVYLPSDCRVALSANISEHFNSTMGKDQTTTPGTPCPTLCDECVGSLTSPADHNSEDAGDGAYGLSSLSNKTRISNHLQMSLQRQHILIIYFKTLSIGPV